MRRMLALLAVAVLAALGVGVAFPAPAVAAVVVPPPPVNVLPSTVKGVIAGAGSIAGGQVTLAMLLRNFAVQASEQKALAALSSGTATPGQIGLVDKIRTKFKMPAVKLGGMVKGAGAVGIALMADQFFVSLGHGISEAFGVDVEGNVCGTGSPLVAALSQVDCTAYNMTQEAIAQANADASVGFLGEWVCSIATPANCVKFLGYGDLWGNTTNQIKTLCFAFQGYYGNLRMEYVRTSDGLHAFSQGAGTDNTSGRCGMYGAAPDVLGRFGGINYIRDHVVVDERILRYGYPQVGGPDGFETSTGVQELTGDPERFLRCELTSTEGAKLSADSATFHESDGAVPPVVCPEFPPEFEVGTVTIWEVGGGQSHELYSESVTPEYSAARSAYPECMGGTCLLDLRVTATGTSCFEDPASCAEWFADPNKASTYSCFYGTHAVDLAECTIYAPTFKDDAVATGNVYGDPTSGEALPGSGVGSELEPGVADPEQPRECFPTGWGVFNPVEWMLKPVQCALSWAFVPRASMIQQTMADADAAWADTRPRQLAAVVAGWEFVPLAPSGCDGITVNVWFLGPPFQIMQACPGDPLESMAMWSRIFGNLLFGVYGVLAIVRHVASIIGFEGLGEGRTLE